MIKKRKEKAGFNNPANSDGKMQKPIKQPHETALLLPSLPSVAGHLSGSETKLSHFDFHFLCFRTYQYNTFLCSITFF